MKNKDLTMGVCCVVAVIIIINSVNRIVGAAEKIFSKGVESAREVVYECDSDIDQISVEKNSGGLRIKRSDVEYPVIRYYENESYRYEIAEGNHKLKIEQKDDNWNFVLGIGFHKTGMTIEIPEDYDGGLSLENCSGSVKLNDISAKTCEIRRCSGSVKLSDVEIQDSLKITETSGGVKFNLESATQKIEIGDTSGGISGRIEADEDEYRISIKNVSGSTNLKESSTGAYTLKVNDVSGGLKIEFD